MSALPQRMLTPIAERTDCRADALPLQALCDAGEPVVLRGLTRDWSLVQAGLHGAQAAMALLRAHATPQVLAYSYGGPEICGRPFYNADFTALNFQVRHEDLHGLLEAIATHLDAAQPPAYYLASLPMDAHLPGLCASNAVDFAAHGIAAQPNIWIGNRITASCHYDVPHNLACCAVGRRHFTVFPPEQIENLYPGPLELNPGGQAISVVDFAAPDFVRYPRFREALTHGRSAVLEPGDALFLPALWWHHVQALASFNVLVNYWWSQAPTQLPAPMPALQHALWALRDRPPTEKAAWRALFDYYVFGAAERAGAHLPAQARQVLGPIDEVQARQLRAMLLSRLNR
ncbi:cupin-like domain-containing protein [Xanthomonas sp. MUS 060]|uniref:cupin-like domain-containing protein n=1 Tax=Xanthomonas sp. MUS 060 TaxID=1588031 RepID=UPI0005F2C595|nr:cupin-like domain-containing protein [Xanthomonas sp. MUS 060]